MIKHVCFVLDWQGKIVHLVENLVSGLSKINNAIVFLAFMKIQNLIFVDTVVVNVYRVVFIIMNALHVKRLNIESWAIISVYAHKDIMMHHLKIFVKVYIFLNFKSVIQSALSVSTRYLVLLVDPKIIGIFHKDNAFVC